tara:strand:- start:177 stop:437 length:261 start_codon:yes stop_codon:yes gene_type:complete
MNTNNKIRLCKIYKDLESSNNPNKLLNKQKIFNNTDPIYEEELWEIETEHYNYVINNQIWKFYPKYEKWVKCSDNFHEIQEHFEII